MTQDTMCSGESRGATGNRQAKALHVLALWAVAVTVAYRAAAAGTDPAPGMVLWYRQPAAAWLEAMPLGNGHIGAMVFGGVTNERIALNESTFWSGRPHDYNDPEAGSHFAAISALVSAGKFREAEQSVDAHFMGRPSAQQAFQPLGDLLLGFEPGEAPAEYRRELDLESGAARVSYLAGGTRFRREAFVSYPDRCLVVRISGDKPGAVSVRAQLKSPYLDRTTAEGDRLRMDGSWKGPIPVDNWLIAPVQGAGLRFQALLRAIPDGGTLDAGGQELRVRGANAVTFILAAATSFVRYDDIGGDPAAACEKVLAAAADKDYATLRKRHGEDFRGLMGRVHLSVGDRAANERPTDERLKAVRGGARDTNLEALCFQVGRYLLASSSRPGGQPANLQGLWNEWVSPPWGSKYTININTEMNYWPAEVCNLSECHRPLFEMLRDVAVTGAKTAKTYYGCGGWVAHHNIDLWRGAAPVDAARYGMWPMGGAWLSLHLWEHYAFTGDRTFLAEYYPVMKGAARFLRELLVEDPKRGWLVTPFSISPEHGFLDDGGQLVFLSPAPTMDVAIIRELFTHCIEASRILGVDEGFRGELEAALKRLPPYRVNRAGHMQEWIDGWLPGDQGHNCSPNFTIFPGSTITRQKTPELAAAIEKWMEARKTGGGWPAAWDLCVWARLGRGDKTGQVISTYVRHSPAANLHNRGSNQSDASFGFAAGVAESLLQSDGETLRLLPALPDGWDEGSVSGLRARGGFEVDMAWRGGKLLSVEVRADRAGPCRVEYGTKTSVQSALPERPLRLDGELVEAPAR